MSPERYVARTGLDVCDQVAKICNPLNTLDIVYFHYIKSFHDGSRISLCNHADWVQHYYTNRYYLTPSIDKDPRKNITANFFWNDLGSTKPFDTLREKFDIANGITLVKKTKNSCSFYYFGGRADKKSILSFFLNNLNVLERFILYFMDKGSNIIDVADKNRIVLPFSQQQDKSSNVISSMDNIRNFIDQTPIKRYWFSDENKDIYFSPRQMACIIGLLEGKSAKGISEQLDLSIRTIENYIEQLKIKLNCSRKEEVIYKLQGLFCGAYSN
jgi:LuxR family quorum-sensing system transcriptional regulator SolR